MPDYKIGGINVRFPYNAYDCQLVYMDRVIHALRQGSNALLESPTGTGKTLCLLCATLAWRESLRPQMEKAAKALGSQCDVTLSLDSPSARLPTILYASRTHSQLHQVIRELKATAYRPKMIVLGSREQMCIHPDVQFMRGKVQTHACRSMVKERGCTHHNRVSGYIKSHPELGTEPVDIEDLVNIGKSKGPCPYYLSRELHSTAEIVFLPYNYLVERENRRSLTGINWERTVLIFDEAHNLESLCADAASFDLPAAQLTACIGEAKQCVDLALSHRGRDNGADTSMHPDNFAVLKALLLELEKRISEIPLDSTDLGFTRPGAYIYEFLAEMKINWQTATVLIDTIEQATSLLEDEAALGPAMHRTSGVSFKLLLLRDALKLIFRGTETKHASCYKVHVQEVRSKVEDKGGRRVTSSGKSSRTLSWWCFNPGIAMEEFASMGIRSIILTSGTLAPLDSFASELKLPFNVRLENPHVVDSSQIWVGVVSCGPSNCLLNSSYKNRDSPEYKQELGNTIVNFSRIVPDGLLVFFPSYYLLNSCIESWQAVARGSNVKSATIWDRISKFKQVVVEPRESALFNQANESFMSKLSDKSSSGAIFFAVCRGKVSEGLDFADGAGRAVLVTGIPYAMKTDPKVRLKREYLDEAFRLKPGEGRGVTGEEWYVQQAARAVNQAVGRVIRHRHDYGAIILCDERFSHRNSQSQMSLWLRPHVKCYSKFGDAAFALTRFFRDRACDPSLLQKPSKELHLAETKPSNLQQSLQGQAGTAMVSNGQLSGSQTKGLSSLSSVSIIQANCAVGSAPGFVHQRSSVDLQDRGASTSQAGRKDAVLTWRIPQAKSSLGSNSISAEVPGILTELAKKGLVNECSTTSTTALSSGITLLSQRSAKKRHPEASEQLGNTSKHPARGGDQTERNIGESLVTISSPDERSGKSKDESILRALPEGDEVSECGAKARVGGGPGERERPALQTTRQRQGPAGKVSASKQETKERQLQFLAEVRARLSFEEYKAFLKCMNSMSERLVDQPLTEAMMASLLDAVSNMFSAPERSFGKHIPSRFRQLYEERLVARCEESVGGLEP